MELLNLDQCCAEITDYYDNPKTGHFLIVNTDNYNYYSELLKKFWVMQGVSVLRASDFLLPNGLSDTDKALSQAAKTDKSVLIGLSQALMLHSRAALNETVKRAVEYPTHSRSVILLDHCQSVLTDLLSHKPKLKNRIIILKGEKSALPKIKISPEKMKPFLKNPISGIDGLLKVLESQNINTPNDDLSVVSDFDPKLFKESVYFIKSVTDIFDEFIAKSPELAGFVKKSYTSEDFWAYLMKELEGGKIFSELINDKFGTVNNLSDLIGKRHIRRNDNLKQLYWLALKRFGDNSNLYLTRILPKSENAGDLDELIFNGILDFAPNDKDFDTMYRERKNLIEAVMKAEPDVYIDNLTRQYLNKTGSLLENEIFYLTDLSERETETFFRDLAHFDYGDKQINHAVKNMSGELYKYLSPFSFNISNTKIPDDKLNAELTVYFKDYRHQKMLNRVSPEFEDKVTKLAKSSPRPYNKLKARNAVIADIGNENSFLYLIDALGAEYLGYIAERAKERGLLCEITVTRGELPTITEFNTGILSNLFNEKNSRKVNALDELKHARNEFDYQKCEYPIHLPRELKIIDGVLGEAHNKINSGEYEKVVVSADHGASRLAVLCGKESDSTIELEEKGVHSGRCCKTDENPEIENAAYENGYAVLADYKRFRGGRAADLEVHGGASLEEVLVPVITLAKPNENNEFALAQTEITINPREPLKLVVSAPYPLAELDLFLNDKNSDKFYHGKNLSGDRKVFVFELPDIKRKGTYSAKLFSDGKDLGAEIEFKTKKRTIENELL